jgi:indole-3-glycerol phosphate synthase
MMNRLDNIIQEKQREVERLHANIAFQKYHPIDELVKGRRLLPATKNFKAICRTPGLTVIAEIKRRSPSRGPLRTITNPMTLAKTYVEGGAQAVSVLTDPFFGGSLEDLQQVSYALQATPYPVLRKDFMIDLIQLSEARLYGADMVLCMVAVLGKKTARFLEEAQRLGLQALVEIQNLDELDIALDSGAEIIGVNNRDLTSFAIDTENAFRLVEYIPEHCIKVAESGIVSPQLARDYHQAGFDAVLVGEALVMHDSPRDFIQACQHA